MGFELQDLIDPAFLEGRWLPLHEDLKRDLAAGRPLRSFADWDGGVVPDAAQRRLVTELLVGTHTGLPYHDWPHPSRFAMDFAAAVRVLERRLGQPLPPGFVQAGEGGAAGHDVSHAGAPDPLLAQAHRVPVGMRDIAVEQYSAQVVDERCRAAGYSPHQRLVAVYGSYATVFAPVAELARMRGTDRIEVRGVLGLIYRVADIRVSDELADLILRDFAVVQLEGYPFERPTTQEGALENLLRFLTEYVSPLYDRLDDAVRRLEEASEVYPETEFTADRDLRWRQKLNAAIAAVENLVPSARASFGISRTIGARDVASVLDAQQVVADHYLDDGADLTEVQPYGIEADCVIVATMSDLPAHVHWRSGAEQAAAHRRYHALLRGVASEWGAHQFDRIPGGLVFSLDRSRLQEALGFALALRRAVERANPADGTGIRFGVGVSAGPAYFDGETCYGQPVDEAVELAVAAWPNTVLATELFADAGGGDVAVRTASPIQPVGLTAPGTGIGPIRAYEALDVER